MSKKINTNWVFGKNAGLDFSTNPPTAKTGYAMNTQEGCASISDTNGNLLFYTDGKTIWDDNNVSRVSGLLGSISSTQSSIIVPDPSNNRQYYVFTADGISGSSNHLNGGLLNVDTWNFTTLSNLVTLPSTNGLSPTEKVTAFQHKNCSDYWVITVLQEGSKYTSTGKGVLRILSVNASGVQHHADVRLAFDVSDIGYVKASPDGSKIAMANYTTKELLIYNFDNATGTLNTTNNQTIDTSSIAEYGVEFSPNSNLLYYADLGGKIHQVDLTASPLNPLLVGALYVNTGALQLGIDDRIYVAKANTNFLAAIEFPDTVGFGCTVTDNFITLDNSSTCFFGLPNLLNPCPKDNNSNDCNCGCSGCNENSDQQNDDNQSRAKDKTNLIPSDTNVSGCKSDPFDASACTIGAVSDRVVLTPCFHFHWGDGPNDQFETHDTEVFYLTVSNRLNDVIYKGLRVTEVRLVSTATPPLTPTFEDVRIVPDKFVVIDCLEPCSSQTREFALITRGNSSIAGNYKLEVDYCYDEIVVTDSAANGTATFDVNLVKD